MNRKEVIMREYETVFIARPNITDSTHQQINERLNGLISRHSGRLFYAKSLGRKTLAYPIEKEIKGIYTCLDYAADSTAVQEIERVLKYDENVIRFLTVVKNTDVDVEARAAEVVARGEDVSVPQESEQEQPAAREAVREPQPSEPEAQAAKEGSKEE
jgi:small subunit ribosomal protein S6